VVDNQLAFIDQASFLGLRATGQGQLGQCTWIYERPVDFDGLRRFHGNLRRGLLGRRVERSPLAFGRHRWVSCQASSGIDVAGSVRARAELGTWLDERAQAPIDPEFGPGWHIGVLRLENHATAITLVASHTVVDGLGLCLAVADAANGVTRDFGYPPCGSRTRRRALIEDLRQTARGAPEVARAVQAAVKLARRERRNLARGRPTSAGGQERSDPGILSGRRERSDPGPVIVPSATVYIDEQDWEARAELLGGTSNSIFAGFAAKLAERVGRVGSADGLVTLSFPVSNRAGDDTRANALSFVDVKVDPIRATMDLGDVRRTIKHALIREQQSPNELLSLLPLTPLVPKAAATKLAGVAFSYDALPVGCSNVGDVDSAVGRADGTDADWFSMRFMEQGVRKQSLERINGQLYLGAGRILGRVFITVVAYQVGGDNTKRGLQELLSQTLKDFDLTGVIGD
jgi:diacylglycerol O-acyltransferase / wax synthase